MAAWLQRRVQPVPVQGGPANHDKLFTATIAMIVVYCLATKLEIPDLMDLFMELISEAYLSKDI